MIRKTHVMLSVLSCCLSASLHAADAPKGSPLKCNDTELATFMDSYQKGLEKNISMTPKADYKQMKNADTLRQINDPRSDQNLVLCGIILDSDFSVSDLVPDFGFIEDMQKTIMALMASDSAGGVDYSAMISAAIAAGMEAAKNAISEGMCELGQKVTSGIDPLANEIYDRAKKKGKQVILDDDVAKELGVKNFDDPLWMQMSDKKIDDQLDDYADYAKWYEDGWSMDDAVGGVIQDEADSGKDDWLDHLESTDPLLDDGVPHL